MLSVSVLSDKHIEIPLVLPSNLSDYITLSSDPLISNARFKVSIPMSSILDDGLFALQNLTKNADTLLKVTVSLSKHPILLSDTLLVKVRTITADITP